MSIAGLTLFGAPKPFLGHFGIIQRNAIASWTKLEPRPKVILFGAEEGAAECASELGLVHVAEIARNRLGTPLLPDLFTRAEALSDGDVMAYVNADIILPGNVSRAVDLIKKNHERFLAVGRRTNLLVTAPIDFSKDWEATLKKRVREAGQLESHTAIDLFIFSKGLFEQIPPLVIGRVWFDQWCIKYAREKRVPVIDITEFATLVHQNHDYSHVVGGKEKRVYGGEEAEENLRYYGSRPHTYTILSATHAMSATGRIKRVYFRKGWNATRYRLWDIFIRRTHSVRRRIGLTRKRTAAAE
ncbi:MAG TPA: hypothetical protein VJN93_15690 [Candidatus Acidoferrum sp.]|nr:hypothetical protein [Candidatus Acidoferrum sp.]